MKAEKVIEALQWVKAKDASAGISPHIWNLAEAVRWLVTQWSATSFTDAELDEVDAFCKAIVKEMDDG